MSTNLQSDMSFTETGKRIVRCCSDEGISGVKFEKIRELLEISLINPIKTLDGIVKDEVKREDWKPKVSQIYFKPLKDLGGSIIERKEQGESEFSEIQKELEYMKDLLLKTQQELSRYENLESNYNKIKERGYEEFDQLSDTDLSSIMSQIGEEMRHRRDLVIETPKKFMFSSSVVFENPNEREFLNQINHQNVRNCPHNEYESFMGKDLVTECDLLPESIGKNIQRANHRQFRIDKDNSCSDSLLTNENSLMTSNCFDQDCSANGLFYTNNLENSAMNENQLDSTLSVASQNKEQYENSFSSISEKEKQLENTVTSLSEDKKQLENTVVSLSEDKKQLENTVLTLSENKKQFETTVSSLSEDKKQLENTVSSLSEDKKQLENTVSSLSEDKNQLENTVSTQSEDKKQLENTVSTLSEDKKQLENTVLTLSDKQNELENTVSSLLEDKKQLEDTVTSVSEDKKQLENTVSSLSDKQNELENTVSSLLEDKKQLENTVSTLSEDKKQIENTVSSLSEDRKSVV